MKHRLRATIARAATVRAAVAVAVFAAVIGFLFGDTLLGKSALWGWDWEAWFHPYAAAFAQRWQAGRLMPWNSNFALGYPQFAEGQTLELYPPVMALLKVVPSWWAMNLCIAGHFLLAATGTYAFGRRRGMPFSSALLAGCAFAFSGFMTTHYVHPGVIIAASWMPALLAVVEGGLQSKRIVPHFVWAGVIVCLQILGGHQQFTFYALLLAAVYIFFRCWGDSCKSGASTRTPPSDAPKDAASQAPSPHQSGWRSWRFGFIALGAMTLIGAGLGALQLAATYEMLPFTFRRALPQNLLVTGYGLPPENLLTFFLPHLFGTAHDYAGRAFFWETCGYVTFLPWLVALFAFLLKPRDRNLWFWLGVVAGSFALAIVEFNPLYQVLPSVPVFNWFRAPSRYVVLCAFGLAMLLGHGHALLMQAEGAARARAVRGTALIAALFAAVVVMANLAFCGGRHFLLAALKGQSASNFFPPVRTRADAIFNSLAGWDSAFMLLHVGGGALLLVFMVQRRLSLRAGSGLLLCLLLADLSRVALTMQQRIPASYFRYQPPVVTFLKSRPGVFRVWTWQADVAQARQSPRLRGLPDDFIEKGMMLPNSNLWSGIDSIGSTSGLDLLRSFNLQKYAMLAPGEQFLTGADETGQNPLVLSGLEPEGRARVLDLLNIRFAVTTQEMPQPDWKLVWDDGLRVYENRRAAPRAFLVGAAQIGPARDALRALLSPDFDFRRTAFVEAAPPLNLPQVPPDNYRGTATIRSRTDTQITLETQSGAPSLLVIGDAFYPGWRAWVDGVETPVVIADYALRGIAVPAGRHNVVCRYQPAWWLPAMGISVFSALAVCATLLFSRKVNRRRLTRLKSCEPSQKETR